MVTIDTVSGMTTYAVPAAVAGEVVTRIAGLSINEWFYIVAILCMLMSNIATTIKALRVQKGTANAPSQEAH